MESPVRIKTAIAVALAICLFTEISRALPEGNVTRRQRYLESSSVENETPRNRTGRWNDRTHFHPRNFTRRYEVQSVAYVTPTPNSLRNNTTYSSREKVRGSVKYHAYDPTRAPFKPKNPITRRNNTVQLMKGVASEISSVNVSAEATGAKKSVGPTTSESNRLLTVRPLEGVRLNVRPLERPTTAKPKQIDRVTTVKPKLVERVTTAKPIAIQQEPSPSPTNLGPVSSTKLGPISSTKGAPVSSINLAPVSSTNLAPITSTNVAPVSSSSSPDTKDQKAESDSANSDDNKKFVEYDFDIDKYTSPEFHNINNVYSQSVSPEIDHFIIPQNVSDYFVRVGSAPAPYKESRHPYLSPNYFDKRFKEVAETIIQNVAEMKQLNDDNSTDPFEGESTSKVDFNELIANPPNKNANLVYKTTKELGYNDSQDALSNKKDYVNVNGMNVLYEASTISTKRYDITSTERYVPQEEENNSEQNEISTVSPSAASSSSNRVVKISMIDNKIPKTENNSNQSNLTRRSDHFKTNETRKDILTTIRMRAHTTVRPRTRISLKNNRIEQNLLVSPSSKVQVSTPKYPEVVKMTPFTRKKQYSSTAPSKIDPVYQESNSPSKIVGRTKSDAENTISSLRKRGSVKFYEKGNGNNVTDSEGAEDDAAKFVIPPTATAWALITMRDAPANKRKNMSSLSDNLMSPQTESINTESSPESSNTEPLYEKMPITTSKISTLSAVQNKTVRNDEENLTDSKTAGPISASSDDYLTEYGTSEKSSDSDETDYVTEEDNAAFESITKLPSSVTTPAYEPSEPAVTETTQDLVSTENSDIPTKNSIVKEDENTEYLEEDDYSQSPSTIVNRNVDVSTVFNKPEKASSVTTDIYTTTDVYTDDTTITSPKALRNSFSTDRMGDESSIVQTANTIPTTNDPLSLSSTNYFTTTVKDDSEETTEDSYVAQATTNLIPKIVSSEPTPVLSRSVPNDKVSTSLPIDTTTITTRNSVDDDKLTKKNLSTEETNSVDLTMFVDDKSTSNDINTAYTTYYSPSKEPSDFVTSTTMSMQTTVKTNEALATTVKNKPMNTDDSNSSDEDRNDSKEVTSSIIDDNEWIDPSDPNIDSNEIPNQGSPDMDAENMPTVIDNSNNIKSNMTTTPTTSSESNIEVIKSNIPDMTTEERGLPGDETTISYTDDLGLGETVDNTGAIAAITISTIGVIALLLLVGLLIVARGRRRAGGYGQRCTPISLDSYSLDNISVTGSTRRKARRPSKRSYGNPAYDESGATSHPMQFAALTNFSLNQESMVSEFNDIPVISTRADEVPAGCETKNRYANVIPLPETRVALKAIAGDDTSEYINANYVRGPKNIKNYYIACQAPLSSTVNDFWRMIWEQNSRVVLMLTELMENGSEKCFEYLPPSEVSDSRRTFGDYQVTLKKREVRDKYVISQLHVKNLNGRLWREITHMWYFWPAKGVPDECQSIIAFLIEARSYLKASQNAKDFEDDGNGSTHQTNLAMEPDDNSNESSEVNIYNLQKGMKNGGTKNDGTESRKRGGPLVVHCSPGTGRTGALIACDIGIRDFEMSRTVDIPKTVYRIRRDRANAVQTKDQYIFIYKVLSEYATKLTGGVLEYN